MWLLALTILSALSVHAIEVTNGFVDDEADAIVTEGGILNLPLLSFNTVEFSQSM
jgi:hypothetical protein